MGWQNGTAFGSIQGVMRVKPRLPGSAQGVVLEVAQERSLSCRFSGFLTCTLQVAVLPWLRPGSLVIRPPPGW